MSWLILNIHLHNAKGSCSQLIKSQWEKHNRAEGEIIEETGSRRNKRRPDQLNEWGQNTQAVSFSSSSFVSMCRERKGWACWEKTHRQQGKTLDALTVLLTFTPQEKPASCLSFPQHLLHSITHGVIINRIQRRGNCCELPCMIPDQRERHRLSQILQRGVNTSVYPKHFTCRWHTPGQPCHTETTRGTRESKTSPLCFLCALMQLATNCKMTFLEKLCTQKH